jgi:hypothetical protein
VTSEGRSYNSCSADPVCSGNPDAPFSASVTAAPADGATVRGLVRLEVRGIEMRNVELLPASGYTPRSGVFKVTGDGIVAWMDLDTTKLPNGALTVRISAFDVAAGQPGAREKIAMPARTWYVNNVGTPATTFSAAVSAAPANGASISGIRRLEVRGSGIANVELLPAAGYTPRLGVFNVSADRTYAWLDFDTRSVSNGARDVRISAYNVMEGQPGAREIVAMPARRWNINNGSSTAPSFTAITAMAPPHGSMISGWITLELRGTGMRNVELLPAGGYTPIYAVFSGDNGFKYLAFDTRSLPNGAFSPRIVAFDVAAGQPNARQIVAMPRRDWVINN